jgi:hypothetical protein
MIHTHAVELRVDVDVAAIHHSAPKDLYRHDSSDEEGGERNGNRVQNGANGTREGGQHKLEALGTTENSERPQGSQCTKILQETQHLESRVVLVQLVPDDGADYISNHVDDLNFLEAKLRESQREEAQHWNGAHKSRRRGRRGQTEHVSHRNDNKKEVESIPFVSYVFFPAVGGNFPNHLENKDEVADKTEIA